MKTGYYYICIDKHIEIAHYDEDVDKWDDIYEPEIEAKEHLTDARYIGIKFFEFLRKGL